MLALKRALLLGGELDGKRIDVHGNVTIFRTPVGDYHLVEIGVSGGICSMFVHESLPQNDVVVVMQMLYEGYKEYTSRVEERDISDNQILYIREHGYGLGQLPTPLPFEEN